QEAERPRLVSQGADLVSSLPGAARFEKHPLGDLEPRGLVAEVDEQGDAQVLEDVEAGLRVALGYQRQRALQEGAFAEGIVQGRGPVRRAQQVFDRLGARV